MPLDEKRAEQIITVFKGLDVTAKLAALNEAKDMLRNVFSPEMTNMEYAKAAMRVEQLYNLIREELRVPQHRIKADTGAGPIPQKSKPKTAKAAKPKATMDMDEMIKAFAMFNKGNTND